MNENVIGEEVVGCAVKVLETVYAGWCRPENFRVRITGRVIEHFSQPDERLNCAWSMGLTEQNLGALAALRGT